MLCPFCQNEHEDEMHFCPLTGKAIRCSNCGVVLTPSNKFCTTCGTPSSNISPESVRKIEERIKPPEEGVETETALEQVQDVGTSAKSSITSGVNTPESVVQVDEPTIAEPPTDSQMEAEEPVLQKRAEETVTLQLSFVSQDKVQEPNKPDDINNPVRPAQDLLPFSPPVQKICEKCDSVLPPGMRFCTTCGAPSPDIPSEPDEKFEKQVEAPEDIVEPLAETIQTPEGDTPELPVSVEDGALEETLHNISLDVKVRENLEPTDGSFEMGSPMVFTQDPTPSSRIAQKICTNCGSIVPPGVRFCTTCGTPSPDIPSEDDKNFLKQVEAPEDIVEPLAESIKTPDVVAPEPPFPKEEAVIATLPINTSLDLEELKTQEIVDGRANLDLTDLSIDRANSLYSKPTAQNSCTNCGSVLPPDVHFCTICGTSAPDILSEPVGKSDVQVKAVKGHFELEYSLDQAQIAEPLADPIKSPDVVIPEPSMTMKEAAIEETLVDAAPVVDEPKLQKTGEETGTVIQEKVEKSGMSMDRDYPDTLTQDRLPTSLSAYKYCIKCGTILPPGAHYCPSCGYSLPTAPGRKNKYLIFTAFVLILCMVVILVLGCLGLIIFGVGKGQINLPDMPVISWMAPIAQMVEEKIAQSPSLQPVQVMTAIVVTTFPLTPTPTTPPTAAIKSTLVSTQTPETPQLPSTPNTPKPTLSSSQRVVPATPCVSYYDEDNKSLKLACLMGKTWETEVVDKSGDVGMYSSLAIENNGNAHISYYDQDKGSLKYAEKAGGTWKIETLDSGDVGLFPSLVLDGSGYPWISYYDRSDGAIKLARWTGNEWNILKVVTMAPEGKRESENYKTSLALDSGGFPLIAYHQYGENVPKLASWTGTEWKIQTIDPAMGSGQQCSLALDSKDTPGVSYYDDKEHNLKYAQLIGSSWKIQVVDKADEVGGFSSLTYDSKDNPHISYFEENKDNLRYAFWSGKSWVIQTVDNFQNVGFYTSLALDKSDRPYIAYYYYTGGDMRVANWDGENWVIKNIDTVGKVGLYPSIKFMMGYP